MRLCRTGQESGQGAQLCRAILKRAMQRELGVRDIEGEKRCSPAKKELALCRNLRHVLVIGTQMEADMSKATTQAAAIKSTLGDGEHVVFVNVNNSAKPALGLIVIEGRKAPSVTVLKMETAVGVPALMTCKLLGNKLGKGQHSLSDKAIEAFKLKVLARDNATTQTIHVTY